MVQLGRLHVVTDRFEVASAAIRAGAPVVQVRVKGVADRTVYDLVSRVRDVAASTGAMVLVNDRVGVAVATGVDGAHVGADDLPVAEARRVLGPGGVLGATARDPETARQHEAAGATYLGVGPAYLTTTKDGLPEPLGPVRVGCGGPCGQHSGDRDRRGWRQTAWPSSSRWGSMGWPSWRASAPRLIPPRRRRRTCGPWIGRGRCERRGRRGRDRRVGGCLAGRPGRPRGDGHRPGSGWWRISRRGRDVGSGQRGALRRGGAAVVEPRVAGALAGVRRRSSRLPVASRCRCAGREVCWWRSTRTTCGLSTSCTPSRPAWASMPPGWDGATAAGWSRC